MANFEVKDDEEQAEENKRAALRIWFSPDHELIYNELLGLPRMKREVVWADLTGNADNTIRYEHDGQKETQENIQRALEALEQEIKKTPSFTTLKRAQAECPSYIDNVEFRMAFLRSERLNAKNAAVRMLRHFEEKKVLFGPDKTCQDVQYTDLKDADIECLKAGSVQILNKMDSGGRRIMFMRPSHFRGKQRISLERSLWYLVMDAVKDENVQKLGLVKVVFLLDKKEYMELNNFRRLTKIYEALPVRTAASYIVASPNIWDSVIGSMLKWSDSDTLVRTRLLTGDYHDSMSRLGCLGVPPDSIPVAEDGSTDLSLHLEWLEERYQREGPRKKRRTIDEPMFGSDDMRADRSVEA